MNHKIKYINKRFGKLVVKQKGPLYTTRSGNKKISWICECDCGSIKNIPQDYLNSGKTRSCGCLRSHSNNYYKVIPGSQFDKLTTIEIGKPWITPKGKKLKTWICECDCGKEVSVIEQTLKQGKKQGKKQSCGCVNCRKSVYDVKLKITVDGVSRTLREWSDITGIKYKTLYMRYRRGLISKDIISK